jgi:hypothetical protein
LDLKKGESKMFLGEQVCGKCGANVKCPSCGGPGKKRDSFGEQLAKFERKYCCGQINSGNYCPRCGRSLKPIYELPKSEWRWICCNGTGITPHYCGF